MLSASSLSFRIPEGGRETASIHIQAEDGSRIQGIVTADNRRIVLGIKDFIGTNVEIHFAIETRGLVGGAHLEGAITITSDIGERNVPIEVDITESAIEQSEPQVATLDDFARLCSGSMREGFRFFTSPAFPSLLDGKNRPYLSLYKGMAHNPVTYQHLEEFLVSTKKKKAIELSLDKQERAVYHLDVSQKDTLYVYRNTWGYVRLEIEVEGDFLEVEKRAVTADDFIGRVYGLEYIVRSEFLREGKNFGWIRIHSVHQELQFQVEATRGEERPIRVSTVRKRRISWLMRDQLKLLMHRIDYRSWHERALRIVSELRDETPEDPDALLYEAYLALVEEDSKRVLEILWPMKEGRILPRNNAQKAMYLHLAKAVDLLPKEKSDIRNYLTHYLQQEPDSYGVLYALQRETDPAVRQPLQKLTELENCFNAGCTSPFLYLEACELLSKEEALLRKLTPFTIQTLRFAQKQGLLAEGLLLRAAHLAAGNCEDSEQVYRLLADGYREHPRREILEAICKTIITGDASRAEYFPWDEAAVKEDLRITRLYELYMETYPGTCRDELPAAIRMFFVYNNTLGERTKALLYANVICRREKDQTTYLNYAKTMQRFTLESLKNGRIDENYAVIYEHILAKPESRLAASELAAVLFARKVTCADPRVRRVIVCHHALAEEQSYPLRDGVAYPNVYSEDACILLEDEKQRRFATTIGFRVDPLMDEQQIAWDCARQDLDHTGLELYLCREKAYQMDVNSRTLPIYQRAAQNEDFTREYRNIVLRKIMEYYIHSADDESVQELLDGADPLELAGADKALATSLLILEGRTDEAYRVITEFGCEGVEPELLLKLAGRLILKRDFAADEELICLSEHVFDCGKFDEVLLTYLRDNMEGNLDRLCELWERIMGFQLDRGNLGAKILKQAVFTRSFPARGEQVLVDHIREKGLDRTAFSYLVYLSEYYFLENRRADASTFRLIERALKRGVELPIVCKLALLKRYSVETNRADAQVGGGRVPVLTAEQEEILQKLLEEMNDRGLRFEFFGRLPARFTQMYQLEDKVFVEERFRDGDRVILHYRIDKNGQSSEEWQSEPMQNVYGGIFVREFLLFYGETLTYYTSVMEDGAIRKTEPAQLSLADMDTFGSTRYKLLNRMLETRALGEDDAFEDALGRYLQQKARVERFLDFI